MMVFVNRAKGLEMLSSAAAKLLKGIKMNVAIIGLRRIGKTELILRFKEVFKEKKLITPYLNVQKVGDLQSFLFLYLREIFIEIGLAKGFVKSRIDVVDWDGLLVLASKLNLENELRRLKEMKDLGLLFETQEAILEKLGIYCLYMLDEFQQVTRLDRRFLEIMRAIVEKQKRIAYISCGSSISMMEEIFMDEEQPFFGQFTRFYIDPLSRKDSLSLSRKLIDKYDLIADENIHNRIYQLTCGNPFYIKSVCQRLSLDFKESITLQNAEYAFLKEALNEKGDIYLVLDYIYNESLSRAYKGEVHRKILLILAKEDGLTLSEISRRLEKPTGEVTTYMKALLHTDLIVKEDYSYHFRDPIMRFWLAETYLGAGRAKLANKVITMQLIKDLQEKYLAASVELGKAKEYELKVKLEAKYGLSLNNYNEEVELDLVGRKEDVVYVFEIKWRNKPADYNTVHDFFEKIQQTEFAQQTKRIFMISREGFTKSARDFCSKHSIEMLQKV